MAKQPPKKACPQCGVEVEAQPSSQAAPPRAVAIRKDRFQTPPERRWHFICPNCGAEW